MGIIANTRHGLSVFNEGDANAGHNAPLSNTGVEQSKGAGRIIAPIKFDRVFSASLDRAQDTGVNAMREAGQSHVPIKVVPEFNERYFGHPDNLNASTELYKQWMFTADTAPPGGQSNREHLEQVKLGWERDVLPSIQANENIAIFSHGFTTRMMDIIFGWKTMEEYLSEPPRKIPNAVPQIYNYKLENGVLVLSERESVEKVVFIDIDGVFVPWQTFRPTEELEWNLEAVQNLNHICESTGAKVVVCSQWRLDHTKEELLSVFRKKGFTGLFHDDWRTPGEAQDLENRTFEIYEWVKEYEPVNWMVLDDFEGITEHLSAEDKWRHIHTDHDACLTASEAEHAISMFRRNAFKPIQTPGEYLIEIAADYARSCPG